MGGKPVSEKIPTFSFQVPASFIGSGFFIITLSATAATGAALAGFTFANVTRPCLAVVHKEGDELGDSVF